MTQTEINAIGHAAQLLEWEATMLADSHTIKGKWPRGENETKREHADMLRTSKVLRRIAERETAPLAAASKGAHVNRRNSTCNKTSTEW